MDTLAAGDSDSKLGARPQQVEILPPPTLAEELPRQQERCRTILERALECGPGGAFLVAILRQALARAEKAAAEGDAVEMLRSCRELSEFQE